MLCLRIRSLGTCLEDETGQSNSGDHDPVSAGLNNASYSCTGATIGGVGSDGILGSSRCSSAVGQGTVEKNGACAVDISDSNQGVVQLEVISITDDAVEESEKERST